ncbi:MAG: methionyl-tRNA formyltransferase [Methylococcales bacterium]|nr:methionyl-tRNA formyltransferase [Methylococcales bacterium]
MKIVFCGTPDFAVPTLANLIRSEHDLVAVYTQPDRPFGRGRKLKACPVKQLAEAHGLLVRQPDSLNDTQEQAALTECAPDLMVVVAYGLILPAQVLAIPVLGAVNIHASLLPRWRGAAPIQRALLAGDPETGVTVMQMAKGLDTGPMLHKVTYPIQAHDTSATLFDRLAYLGADALLEVLPALSAGQLRSEAQDDHLATYANKLTVEEAVIDWTLPARQIALHVRGYNPWPVARTLFKNQLLKIWAAEPVTWTAPEVPGTVQVRGKDYWVITGDKSLKLLEVQAAGGKRMSAQAFANAHPLAGVRLG